MSIASHPKAGVHFRNAVDHLHLIDMRFILKSTAHKLHASDIADKRFQPIVSVGSVSIFIITWPA